MSEPRQAIPIYGRNLLSTLPPELFESCIVFCAPEPWEMVSKVFKSSPIEVVVWQSMDQTTLENLIQKLPKADNVFGIGGGTACDTAKMYAWKTGSSLVLVPTIMSVDAPFTNAIGARVDDRVRYIGETYPERLLIDIDLLQAAPPRLNRAGIGDVLSIYTALWDWKLANRVIGERYDETIAAQSQTLLDRLFQGAAAIRDCTEEGLRLLADLYVGEVGLCVRFGNARPEEGSEHAFAYCIEHLTRKHVLHGELVAFSALLTAVYQNQPIKDVLDFLNTAGVEYRSDRIGLTREDIFHTLLFMPRYLEQEKQLSYGVFHHKRINEQKASSLIRKLEALDILR